MSRTNRGEKGSGYEYWKSLHPKWKSVDWCPGKDSKKITSKYIRRKTKQDLKNKENNEE
jgi:hypothetical protein